MVWRLELPTKTPLVCDNVSAVPTFILLLSPSRTIVPVPIVNIPVTLASP